MMMPADGVTYILPIRRATPATDDGLGAYLVWLATRTEAIVIDGSPPEVYAANAESWAEAIQRGLIHAAPPPDLATEMGKVGNVLAGIQLASHDRVVIADDDVRYDERALTEIVNALDTADVVRPQNYFDPLPWHACWDTGRTLLNRVTGGDWPGTIAVRRSILIATGGYDGRALFENLELVRTVVAAGGRERVAGDIFVLRHPATTRHFWSQRVRQAYDEFARPGRLAWQLMMLPAAVVLAISGQWRAIVAAALAVVVVAEVGRWRDEGRRVFPMRASFLAPMWLAERAVCVWLAVLARVCFGGMPYRGRILRHAATPMRVLRERYASRRAGILPDRSSASSRSS